MILPEENLLNTTVFTPSNDTVTQFNTGIGFYQGLWEQIFFGKFRKMRISA